MKARRPLFHLPLFLILIDLLAVMAAYYGTLLIRFHSAAGAHIFDVLNDWIPRGAAVALPGTDFEDFYIASAPRIIFFLAITVLTLYAFRDLYAGRRFLRPPSVAGNVLIANGIALLLFFGYFYLRRNQFHPRSMFLTMLLLNAVFCLGLRGALSHALGWVRRRLGWDDCRAILVGRNRSADFLAALVEITQPHGIRIVDRLDCPPDRRPEDVIAELDRRMAEHGAHMVICAEPSLSVPAIMQILEASERWGARVKILSADFEVLVSRSRLASDRIYGMPLVHFGVFPTPRGYLRLKRAYSVVLAALALIVLSPVLLACALLILIFNGRPVFFLQSRMGMDRRPFLMLKFRTMHHRAEELQAEVEAFNESGAGLFKIRNDPRVTSVGRVLRRFSLDELPQLLNVLRGDMTVVGPRPLPRRDFDNYYEQWHYSRHGGLPGLTCLWQISGRSDVDFHNMCIMDVYYLRNQSPLLDARIILRTIGVVLFARGAY